MAEETQSARHLRARYQEEERTLARLRLMVSAAERLQERSAATHAFAGVLGDLLAFLAMDTGAILTCRDGALRVAAAAGRAPPTGAQMGSQGPMAIALRQQKIMIRRDVTSALLVTRDRTASLELFIPAVCDGRIVGLLGAVSRQPASPPGAADVQSLTALGGLVGTAIRAFDTTAPSTRVPDPAVAALTPREQQVFALLPRGLTNASMARELGVAPGTVKIHVERILGKLRVRDRTQAAVKAARMGYGE